MECERKCEVVCIKISLEHVDSWAKILFFRIRHLWNSTTELISIIICIFWISVVGASGWLGKKIPNLARG